MVSATVDVAGCVVLATVAKVVARSVDVTTGNDVLKTVVIVSSGLGVVEPSVVVIGDKSGGREGAGVARHVSL